MSDGHGGFTFGPQGRLKPRSLQVYLGVAKKWNPVEPCPETRSLYPKSSEGSKFQMVFWVWLKIKELGSYAGFSFWFYLPRSHLGTFD